MSAPTRYDQSLTSWVIDLLLKKLKDQPTNPLSFSPNIPLPFILHRRWTHWCDPPLTPFLEKFSPVPIALSTQFQFSLGLPSASTALTRRHDNAVLRTYSLPSRNEVIPVWAISYGLIKAEFIPSVVMTVWGRLEVWHHRAGEQDFIFLVLTSLASLYLPSLQPHHLSPHILFLLVLDAIAPSYLTSAMWVCR
jgi:hypothetical protein